MGKLIELCCRVIARVIGVLTFAEVKSIVKHLPSARCVELIWQELCRNMKDSQSLYLLMQNHLLIKGTLNCISWNGQNISYRRQSMPHVDLLRSIRIFNAIKENSSFDFLVILNLDNNIDGLESLIHLHSLVVLSVFGIRDPEQLVVSWHIALKVNSQRWNKLRVLNIPQLTSPKLFYDSWQLIPSLLWMGANLDNNTIRSIPKLNQLVTEAPIKSPMEILCWLAICQNLDGKVILELELNRYLTTSSIPTYFPQDAKCSRLPGLYGHMRRAPNKRTTLDTQNEPRPRTLKRPRYRGIRKTSSIQRLFRWATP